MLKRTIDRIKVLALRHKSLLILTLLITCSGQSAYLQGPPDVVNDPAWVAVPSMTDEFNDSVIDARKWTWAPPWGTFHGQPGSSQACLTDALTNRLEEGGSLKLIVTDTAATCKTWNGTRLEKPYTAGALFSRDTIRYGYFEIRMRIPPCDSMRSSGFGPNFWMWHLMPYNDSTWSEIDIYEIDGFDNTYTCNVHYETPRTGGHWSLRQPGEDGYDAFDERELQFGSEWHVFACEWSEYQVNFYHNGRVVHCTDRYCDDLKYMNLVIDINVPAVNFGYVTVPEEAVFPYVYEIDYIRTYQRRD